MEFDLKNLQGTLNVMNDTIRRQLYQEQWARVIPGKNPMVEQLEKIVEETQAHNK